MAQRCQLTPGAGGSVQEARAPAGNTKTASTTVNKDLRVDLKNHAQSMLLDLGIMSFKAIQIRRL
jgi:hypothetical protein